MQWLWKIFARKNGLTSHQKFCKSILASGMSLTDASITRGEKEKILKDNVHEPEIESHEANTSNMAFTNVEYEKEKETPSEEDHLEQAVDETLTKNQKRRVSQSFIAPLKEFKCKFCGKVCKRAASLATHEKACQKKHQPSTIKAGGNRWSLTLPVCNEERKLS